MHPKKKADKPAPGNSKAEALKAMKANKPVKTPQGGRTGKQPSKKKTIEDHIEEATGKRPSSNGQQKKLTTDELAEKLQRKMIIHYVAVEKETEFLKLEAMDKNGNLPKDIVDTFKCPVHNKLKAAIQKLAPHAAILKLTMDGFDISKYKKLSDVPEEYTNGYTVSSVHFKYGKKGDSVQINATCKTFRDKAFNFTTPIEYLDADSESAYEFVNDLIKIRQNIFNRIDLYMSGEERGDVNAIGMFAESAEEDETVSEAKIASDGQEHDVTNLYNKDN